MDQYEDGNVQHMDCPAMLPDLNPIENIWSEISRGLNNMDDPPTNVAEVLCLRIKAVFLSVFATVNGGWSVWTTWSSCDVTCANGLRTRKRYCTNPAPKFGGLQCPGVDTMSESCFGGYCPVDGLWSPWTPWTPCSTSCGGGSRSRRRTCDNPAPEYGGHSCDGDASETDACNEKLCPVDGAWSVWSNWVTCPVTCGGGTTQRYRTCDNPLPLYGGNDCPGLANETMLCSGSPCPVHGVWSAWGAWSECSVTCAGGKQKRKRECTVPLYGGQPCLGHNVELRPCASTPCPVNGDWSTWSQWGSCSVTCSNGTRTRERKCDRPVPAYGGRACVGERYESATCFEVECPVHGVWSAWGTWSECSVTCADGKQRRKRECTDPLYGGQPCMGHDVELRPCASTPCPVNGDWSTWSQWGSCSVTCSNGTRTRERKCDRPVPAYGGRACVGERYESATCFEVECPVNGQWSAWSSWSPCSKSCSEGFSKRSRSCNNPTPTYGGLPCKGDDSQVEACLLRRCPVDGGWSLWGGWTPCSVSCGWGYTKRQRICDNPKPLNGGQYCLGLAEESTNCFIMECPIDGGWSGWSPWSLCSQTCSGGGRQRIRSCTSPFPQYGGKDCLGEDWQNMTCMEDPCPVDGVWTPWTRWRPCSAECNGGFTFKNRTCDNPPPAYGGLPCTGREVLNRSCNMQQCEDKYHSILPDDEPMEAPGAIGIGIIGLAFVFTMLAAFAVMDLLTIHRHFAFMRTNMQHFWSRVTGKEPPPTKKKPRSKRLRSTTKKKGKQTSSSTKSGKATRASRDVKPAEVLSDYVPVMTTDVEPLTVNLDDVSVRMENERILSNNINIPHQNDLNKEENFNTMARKKLESRYREVADITDIQLQATQL
ncbi:hypothetical protein LSH36_66g05030 [Paralvinella palmiformis]|uniref:Hemicentin-1 n=1 Tax=Paralvinella palmiformis TaxID=53620 RepID=A0AAD9K3K9_9ANNE|nr:hypothetical protein LSH36_66g05030 [Paralvinella palmiformis]